MWKDLSSYPWLNYLYKLSKSDWIIYSKTIKFKKYFIHLTEHKLKKKEAQPAIRYLDFNLSTNKNKEIGGKKSDIFEFNPENHYKLGPYHENRSIKYKKIRAYIK